MRIAKIGRWAGSLSLRLTEELKSLGLEDKDNVSIVVEDNKIIIEKVK